MNKWCFVLLLFCLFACKKDGPIQDQSVVQVGSGQKVLIGNEGNFQFSNSTLSLFQKSDSSVAHHLYKEINGYDLGDVCQSLAEKDEKIFVVVNNSGKVEVIKKSTFKVMGSISGLSSPRNVLPVSRRKAYVTDYKANGIYILDLDAYSIKDFITLNSWTEGIVAVDGQVFVCGKTSDYIYKIDPSTDSLKDSLLLGAGPTTVVQDRNNKLWVLCESNYGDARPSSIYKIDPKGLTVEFNLTFSADESPSNLIINSSGDTLFFLNQGVRKMGVNQNELPTSSFISAQGTGFYALGIDYDDNTLYVSDAKDYISNSTILMYNTKGVLLNQFLAGINAGSFLSLP